MTSPPSHRLPYRVLDVFTHTPLEGNPVAVFPDAGALDDTTMQRIAQELNLSETVFVVPATRADCVGAAAHLHAGARDGVRRPPDHRHVRRAAGHGVVRADAERFAVEERVGRVAIRVEPGEPPMFWLTTPPISFGNTFEPAACARALGLDEADLLPSAPPQLVTAGNPNVYVALRSRPRSTARRPAWPSCARCGRASRSRSACSCSRPTEQGAYARMFAPEHGVVEDPATGSATGPLAAYMMRHGLAPHADGTRLVSEQGTHMGRRSLLHVLVHGEHGADGIEVGGTAVPVAEALMTL